MSIICFDMPLPRLTTALFLLSIAASVSAAAETVAGLRVPPGFEVREFAGDDLAHDIFTMTLDPRGRVVVAGRGYIRLLIDDDGDGRADRAVQIADHPKDGAMGLLWEGDALYAVGDGGLRRFKIGPDDKAVGPSELIRPIKTGGEHHAHALRRGPDGWLYLLCGNNTGISAKDAQRDTSPVKEPVAGGVLRFPPDFAYSEIVADGFRNPYDFDFNGDGELFTYDSDNERCVGLPWYEGCRFYHVIPGGHYGWQAPQHGQFWRMPPYFPDVVAPIVDLGRGSPTGVVCYRHGQFPEKYRSGFFLGEWTFGRIWYVPLSRKGSTYEGKPELFLEATGDQGFAPVALRIHPMTGDMYVAIGGRGTRGAVYRVRFPAGMKDAERFVTPSPARRVLDWQPELYSGVKKQVNLGREQLVMRRTMELLWRYHEKFLPTDIIYILHALPLDSDRPLRQAAARLIGQLSDLDRKGLFKTNAPWFPGPPEELLLGLGVDAVRAGWHTVYSDLVDSWARLDSARLIQLRLGGIGARSAMGTAFEGYSPREHPEAAVVDKLARAVRPHFPSKDRTLDRELSRTLAMLADGDPEVLVKVASKLTSTADPIDDIHYLIVLARLTAPRTPTITKSVAEAIVGLDRRFVDRKLNRDNNWPPRIAELHAELSGKDPALNAAMLSHPDFARPGNALFTRAPGFDRHKAAERFLAVADKDPNFAWNAELVQLMDELPPDRRRTVLLRLWDRGGFEDAILPILAKDPRPDDRPKLFDGLRSPQLAQIKTCLAAIEVLPDSREPGEFLALVRTLRSLPDDKAAAPVADRLTAYLRRATGQSFGRDRAAWTDWLTRTHPDVAAKLGGPDGVDVAGWQKRFAGIDWNQGSGERGQAIFSKASCATCHSGGQALGPDLRGVGGRFSRDDLLTAIVQPSKDVPARYRTTQITTTDGKVYQGLIIYEAVDGLILQTGAATTVRIGGGQIESRGVTETSLMPAGLLDKLSDGEIADLVVYLRALK